MLLVSVQDFLDASAFERSALSSAFPLVDVRYGPQGGLDLRTNTVQVQAASIVGASSRGQLIQELRPLFFGSAWKVLDLLIEFGLNQRAPNARWSIASKARSASGAPVPPLSSDNAVWDRVASVYAATVEQRHCLVHRSFNIAPDGTMTGMTSTSGAVRDLTAAEQAAFCRLSQRAALVFEAGTLIGRHRLDLVACLDSLAAHHQLGLIGGGARATVPLLIQVDAAFNGKHWTVDTQQALSAAQSTFPGRSYYDIRVHFGTSGIPALDGALEDAPQGSAIPIDPQNPPPWTIP